jgi:ankyrin repeat protein
MAKQDQTVHYLFERELAKDVDGLTATTNENGEDELIIAVKAKNYEFVELLLQEGANPNFMNGLFNSLFYAAENGDIDMLLLLIEHGGDPTVESGDFDLLAMLETYYISRNIVDKDKNCVRLKTIIENYKKVAC